MILWMENLVIHSCHLHSPQFSTIVPWTAGLRRTNTFPQEWNVVHLHLIFWSYAWNRVNRLSFKCQKNQQLPVRLPFLVCGSAALSFTEICIQCGAEFVPPDDSRARLKLLRKMLRKRALLELCRLCLWDPGGSDNSEIRGLRCRIKHLADCERQASVDGKNLTEALPSESSDTADQHLWAVR